MIPPYGVFKVSADYLPRRTGMELFFIGTLPYNTIKTELSYMYIGYGNVVSAKLITYHFIGESK